MRIDYRAIYKLAEEFEAKTLRSGELSPLIDDDVSIEVLTPPNDARSQTFAEIGSKFYRIADMAEKLAQLFYSYNYRDITSYVTGDDIKDLGSEFVLARDMYRYMMGQFALKKEQDKANILPVPVTE